VIRRIVNACPDGRGLAGSRQNSIDRVAVTIHAHEDEVLFLWNFGSSAKRVGSFHGLETTQMPITRGDRFVHPRVVGVIHEPWAANSEGTILLLLLNLSSNNNTTLLLATRASP
jgi:hypothetical protein